MRPIRYMTSSERERERKREREREREREKHMGIYSVNIITINAIFGSRDDTD